MAGGRAGQGMKIAADAEMHFIEKRAWHPPSPFFVPDNDQMYGSASDGSKEIEFVHHPERV